MGQVSLMLKPCLHAFTAVAVGLVPMSATASAYLCIEDAITGFDWKGSKWVETTFMTRQWLIRKHDEGEQAALACLTSLAEQKLPTEPMADSVSPVVYGCYSRVEVGAELDFVFRCKEHWAADKKLELISCDDFTFTYQFIPNGEYVAWATLAAPRPDLSELVKRDSLGIAVGRCSVVSD